MNTEIEVGCFLTMVNCPSWNGKWSQANKLHMRKMSIRADVFKHNKPYEEFLYHFDDGWVARVVIIPNIPSAKMERLLARSSGFCSYDWMLDNIAQTGKIQ